MNRYTKIITKTLLIITPILFLPFISYAIAPDNAVNTDNSIYKYNALQNEINFSNSAGNTESFEEKLKSNIDKQNISVEKSENMILDIENKGGIQSFFVGNNSGIGTLKFQMVQMNDQSSSLNILMSETEDTTMKTQIASQIEVLVQEKKKVEDFILKYDNRFSLFGWFISSL